jgi:hypothetical protein
MGLIKDLLDTLSREIIREFRRTRQTCSNLVDQHRIKASENRLNGNDVARKIPLIDRPVIIFLAGVIVGLLIAWGILLI